MRDSKGRFVKGHTLTQGKNNPLFGKKIHPATSKAVTESNKRRKMEKASNWKGGRILHQSKYWIVLTPDHPNADRFGYVREHRLVMEKKIGRYLDKSEIVHHINKDTKDNRPSNLSILSSSEHARLHSIERWKKEKSQ